MKEYVFLSTISELNEVLKSSSDLEIITTIASVENTKNIHISLVQISNLVYEKIFHKPNYLIINEQTFKDKVASFKHLSLIFTDKKDFKDIEKENIFKDGEIIGRINELNVCVTNNIEDNKALICYFNPELMNQKMKKKHINFVEDKQFYGVVPMLVVVSL